MLSLCLELLERFIHNILYFSTFILLKVKVSYCIVGHTHEEIDAIIGTVISHLRGKNIETFEDFRRECNAAILKQQACIHGVDMLVGIPDYDETFKGINEHNIQGISSCHEFRLSSDISGIGVKLHYKELSTDIGWFPRPIQVSDSFKDTWNSIFNCSIRNQGSPVSHSKIMICNL